MRVYRHVHGEGEPCGALAWVYEPPANGMDQRFLRPDNGLEIEVLGGGNVPCASCGGRICFWTQLEEVEGLRAQAIIARMLAAKEPA